MTVAARRRIRLIGAITGVVLLVIGAGVAVRYGQLREPGRAGWTLRWHDEFDGATLDARRWNVQDAPSPRNNELQYYTPRNLAVSGGRLRLTSDQVEFQGRSYTSAAVDTYGRFDFTYGRVEIRAKLPEMGQGVWPALWLLGTQCHPLGSPCPWPTDGASEIDIMEAVNSPAVLYGNLHYGAAVGQSLATDQIEHPTSDLSAAFHRYAIEWEPGAVVRWYLDDELIGERSVPFYFARPMYLLMNTAVGGDWPGPPDDTTRFPQHFELDYVRVFQRT